ncbi:UV-stimulated scaffold protein A [Chionoecetes opilio]|uniref:UV-stimulated scaffold protein A n=1 Tax=Chionoecetes opilio TaxID=41210 RepID=A0A8J4Y697_CHIOP|nr:UV-stimulated scaffold protein A [Chionoecetes opilio]
MDGDRQAAHLKYLVEKLTTSGKDHLDEEKFKKIKKICKRSDIYIVELYRLVTKQLEKKHAEIRFSAFQICDELFRRSHCFRELLLKDFLQFVDLALGLDPKRPLPKPDAVARKLKQKCVEAIQYWYDHFSDGYLTLKRAYNYLRDCKKVDFAELTARTEAERQRAEEERRRVEEIRNKKIEKVKKELEISSQEIDACIAQFHNCFKLLIPDLHDFFIPLSNEAASPEEELVLDNENDIQGEDSDVSNEELEENAEYGSEFMRGHGIMKGTNVKINLEDVRKVQKTEDNEVVIENLKECVSVLKIKLLPSVRKWEEKIQPYSEGNESLIKTIIDHKISIQNCVKKFESLNIVHKENQTVAKDIDSDSDEDDFIEVPWDDPRVVSAAASEAALLGMTETSSHHAASAESDDPGNQPSSSGLSHKSSHVLQSVGNSSSKESEQVRFPDEYVSKNASTPRRHQNPLAGLSQVWTATPDLHDQEEIQSTGGILGIATERVNYERTWEPVKWACRAPLKRGRLCPRQDRERCPLHGPIIPRGETGEPLLPEDAAREQAAREQYEIDHPAWQEPQLLAELKAATGVDLKVEKNRYKRKRKYENLTDLKKITPKERLAKQIFNPKAVRRLNAALAKEHKVGNLLAARQQDTPPGPHPPAAHNSHIPLDT